MIRDKHIIFRVTAEEFQTIKQAAEKDERLLSDYVRRVLLRASRPQKRKGGT